MDNMRKINRRGQLGIIIASICALIVVRWQRIQTVLTDDKLIM